MFRAFLFLFCLGCAPKLGGPVMENQEIKVIGRIDGITIYTFVNDGYRFRVVTKGDNISIAR